MRQSRTAGSAGAKERSPRLPNVRPMDNTSFHVLLGDSVALETCSPMDNVSVYVLRGSGRDSLPGTNGARLTLARAFQRERRESLHGAPGLLSLRHRSCIPGGASRG